MTNRKSMRTKTNEINEKDMNILTNMGECAEKINCAYEMDNGFQIFESDELEADFDTEEELDESDDLEYYIENSSEIDSVSLLFKEISKLPLLSAEEEIELGKIIFENKDEESVLKARNKLVDGNHRLAISVARKYRRRTNAVLGFSDIIGHAEMGLIKAAENYDYRMGYRFSTYAVWVIRQCILKGIEDEATAIRVPAYFQDNISKYKKFLAAFSKENKREPDVEEISKALHMDADKVEKIQSAIKLQTLTSIEAPVADKLTLGDTLHSEGESPNEALFQEQLTSTMHGCLDELTEREKSVVKMRYGIAPYLEPMTLEAVAQIFNVSRERIRQIEKRALEKLSRKKVLKDFYAA